jgi:hypothetical protein
MPGWSAVHGARHAGRQEKRTAGHCTMTHRLIVGPTRRGARLPSPASVPTRFQHLNDEPGRQRPRFSAGVGDLRFL